MDDKDRKHYKWGMFYFNPNNKSIIVPKRLGLGWTLNFAHPISWVIILIIVGFLIYRVASK
ncbi:putative membrane protein [Paenibacillus aceris]|uniref:Membrane protein n=1 Tax=Paenibacillus aceris TaxID=869555 RepID=A0ABS4I086_9BACL|nr:putative membrane protein [Paenibacillus aceris]